MNLESSRSSGAECNGRSGSGYALCIRRAVEAIAALGRRTQCGHEGTLNEWN